MASTSQDKLFDKHPDQHPARQSPALIIVMGVSGCGKSTVGQALANKFRIQFVDGDSLHPQSNIDKMSNGIPLTDEDRFPWLTDIRREAARKTTREALQQFYDGQGLKDPEQPRAGIVIACSALKRTYRDMLRGTTGELPGVDKSHVNLDTYFVYLKGSRKLLLDRMEHRKGHFFKAAMLDSQLATLEEPTEEEENTEGVFVVDISQTEAEVVENATNLVSRGVGLNILED